MESNGKNKIDENPFAGFGVLDMSNNLKVIPKTQEEDEKPDLEAMEKALKAEEEKKKALETPEVTDEEETPEVIVTNTNTDEGEFSYKVLIDYLTEKGIIDVEEEDLKDVDFTQDEVIEKVIGKTAQRLSDKRVESYSEELKKAIEWEENGGDINQFYDYFYNKVKYSDLKFETDDTELQKAVLKDYLRSQGEEDEARINTRIEKYELGGILEDEATIALERLQKLESQSEAEVINKQKETAEKNRLKQIEDWNSLKKAILETEEIQGFKVTPKQREQLLNHITKPVTKDGKTQLQLNNEKNGQKAQLLYAYLDMMDYDVSKLEKQVKNKVTSELRKNLSKFSDTRSKSNSSAGRADVTTEDNPFEGFKRIM